MRRSGRHCYRNWDGTTGTLAGWGAGVKTRQLKVDQHVAGTF